MDINALAVERLETDLNEMALATMLAILQATLDLFYSSFFLFLSSRS